MALKTLDQKILLFDWSGTVSNDIAPVYESNCRLLEQHGMPRPSLEDWRNGSSWNASSVLSAEFGFKTGYLYRRFGEILDDVLAHSDPAQMYPGAKELFTRLFALGKHVEIISSHPQSNLESEIATYGLGGLVRQSMGNVNDKTPVISAAFSRMGAEASNVAYIGDTVQDIRAAKQAGVFAVGVTYGYHSRELLAAEAPDVLADSLKELADMIR
ncbi:MAG TPA: HAD family hydrolase [Patescibacteria group bacterium]|jgi:phosphoglycolate phosphatase-like HAD superfamily hydrolase|nr:HAD family hydrolase [Patescibacteria group bacterium]